MSTAYPARRVLPWSFSSTAWRAARRSHYAVALARELVRRGWRGAVAHFRGCSGEPNRLPRAYHSGDADEIRWILRRFAAESRGAPLSRPACRSAETHCSNGSGEDAEAKHVLLAAAAISAPVDLMAAGDALGRGFNLVYTRAFLATMRRKAEEKLARFPGLFDGNAMRRASTLRAFDNVVTAPLHGFRDTDDYWTRASAKPVLRSIQAPTLLLNARNDPFLPAVALPGPSEVSGAVRLEFPDEGGHAAFVSSPFPGDIAWMPRRVTAFFEEAMAARDTGSHARANGIIPHRGTAPA